MPEYYGLDQRRKKTDRGEAQQSYRHVGVFDTTVKSYPMTGGNGAYAKNAKDICTPDAKRGAAICSWRNAFFKLFSFSHDFLGKRMQRGWFVLYTIAVIFEKGLPAEVQYAQDTFLDDALIHFRDPVFPVFEDDGNFFYGKA